jgi:hypothetical protein
MLPGKFPGERLGLAGIPIPPLAELIRAAPS